MELDNEHSKDLLLRDCFKGDRKYQKALYERYSPAIFSLCLRHLKTQTDAEDMLQEVFVTLFTNRDTCKAGDSLDELVTECFYEVLHKP